MIDYSLPSRERRLWVLESRSKPVLAHELVAHGRMTGDDRARRFSNRRGSLQSSLGTVVTGASYRGVHGLSALSPEAARRAIELIRGGPVLFAYYPSPALRHALGQDSSGAVAIPGRHRSAWD
jgi:hypothetical protein